MKTKQPCVNSSLERRNNNKRPYRAGTILKNKQPVHPRSGLNVSLKNQYAILGLWA